MKLDHLPLFEASEGAAESRIQESGILCDYSMGRRRRRQMNIFELAWRGVVSFRVAASLPLFLGASLCNFLPLFLAILRLALR